MRKVLRRSRKRLIRYGLLTANAALLVAVIGFIVQSSPSKHTAVRSSAALASTTLAENPLDRISSADIAVNIARMTSLPESTAIVNQADSVNSQLAGSSTDNIVITKPQVVGTSLKSRKDIQTYTAVAGDTIANIAIKFGVTSDSIKWSNNLTANTIPVGTKLTVPPINGIVYTVKPGDTAEALAREYRISAEALIAFNDAEVGGLPVGQKIVIPDGTRAAPIAAPAYRSNVVSVAWGGIGGGSYSPGYCTDYASKKGGAPGGWGNANTWASYAARTPGWTVSKTPRVGAIAQTTAGWAGHVGIVEAVSADGTKIKYSDMNGIAGFGRVGYSDWVPVHSAYQNFIYR